METITLKNGTKVNFEPLVYNEKNLRKVNINRDGVLNGEGVWAVLSDKDIELYDKDAAFGIFVCMLVNDAYNFFPFQSWGRHVVAEFHADNRPVVNLSLVDYTDSKNTFFSKDCKEPGKAMDFKKFFNGATDENPRVNAIKEIIRKTMRASGYNPDEYF